MSHAKCSLHWSVVHYLLSDILGVVGKHLLVVELLFSSCMAELALHLVLLAVSVLAAKKKHSLNRKCLAVCL